MKIKISDNTKVYVACPANKATGGPELLHQIVYQLRKLNIDALMYYYNSRGKINPIHNAYSHYENPFTNFVSDSKENILIVPEINTNLLSNYKKIQKIIWWLSVDNYYAWTRPFQFSKIYLYKIFFFFRYFKTEFILNKHFEEPINHLVQSYYALEHLLSHKINKNQISYLSDYLNKDFLASFNRRSTQKNNLVIYNPKKGFQFTQKLIAVAKNINFVPIQNMSRNEVISLLSRAKVYIDFGSHPGKDRIPREAAVLGACVITNLRGSAGNAKDLPIPIKYKFNETEENIPRILSLVEDCLNNYENNNINFDSYRRVIYSEPKKFNSDLKSIFKSSIK